MSKIPTAKPARILRLQAENVKRLKVVDITPGPGLVEIAGKNGNGKTSVLDAIKWAMAGKGEIQWKPIRAGEEEAKIVLTLGDDNGMAFKVTRKFKLKDDPANDGYSTSLIVEAADGSKPKGPQELLDSFLGRLSIDPVEFARASGRERVEMVKALVPEFDFAAHEAEVKRLYDIRLEAGRDAVRLKGVADTFEDRPDLPKAITNPSAITQEFEAAQRTTQANARARATREEHASESRRAREDAQDLRGQANALEQKIAQLRAEADRRDAHAQRTDEALAALPPVPEDPDVTGIRRRLDALLAENREIERAAEGRRARHEADEAQRRWNGLDERMKTEEGKIRNAVAMARLPVRGLAFSLTDVLLDGIPFDQASDAQQVRVSLAIAMALNPAMKVIRIRDGSLLDEDAMAILREVADDAGYQIWIERVQADDEQTAFILQDGMVRE